MLHGVISFQELATPICGLRQSSSPMPTARSMPRAGARSMPSVTMWLCGLRCCFPAASAAVSLMGSTLLRRARPGELAHIATLHVRGWPIGQLPSTHSSYLFRRVRPMANQPPVTIAIACQGGGSHTAFTAGVLSRWLEDDALREVEVKGLSGTSGGAICALLAWSALLEKRPEDARRRLA